MLETVATSIDMVSVWGGGANRYRVMNMLSQEVSLLLFMGTFYSTRP